MQIVTYNGDLLQSKANILVNAVNKLGFMGGGIALCFRKKFPEMYDSYKELCLNNAYDNNFVTFYTYPKDKFNGVCIANLLTVNNDFKGNYNYIIEGLNQLKHTVEEDASIKSIAIPPLGCGIGGLDILKVFKIIIDTFNDTDLTLELYNFPKIIYTEVDIEKISDLDRKYSDLEEDFIELKNDSAILPKPCNNSFLNKNSRDLELQIAYMKGKIDSLDGYVDWFRTDIKNKNSIETLLSVIKYNFQKDKAILEELEDSLKGIK